ncbi:MAG TPA: histidine phosphatase family protein [Candidatus Angelobacter sp.]|jgi:broad specificity phosphatase PhoE|nr:histidine phosphatase family protein [Candidatus Angelobacter sp.]
MSTLFLVRHGQASFLERNYDKLSAKGEEQSRILGRYWAELKVGFDRVYCGPKVRQRETARIAGEAYKAAGLSWPEPKVVEAFDEFQAEAVMERSLPRLVEIDADIKVMHQAFQDARTRPEQFKTFQQIFEVIIGRWADGKLPLEGIEPWADFSARVQRGLAQLAANGGSGEQIAIFSSGGPVGVAMQRALDLSTEATLKAAWMVRNCSFSEFLFSAGRFTLSTYNATPHFTDPEFLTHR